MKREFQNRTEAGFYDYYLSRGKHKESTVWQYISKLRKIDSANTLITKNLDPYIADYETGANQVVNATCHNAYSCALKRLQDYQLSRGIVVI